MLNRLGASFRIFYNSQRFTGVLLIVCTAFSLFVANSPIGDGYIHFWTGSSQTESSHAIHLSPLFIVNDILMAIFFLLVGVEIKREAMAGELSSFLRASLPVAAAAGGMLVPALLYHLFNSGSPTSGGWGIPMATDIAFAIGILSLLGSRVPDALKILLTAIAVADDLGAVLVIAIFYSDGIQSSWLIVTLLLMVLLFFMNKKRVESLWPYLLTGCILWYSLHMTGVHATISGVLLAFFIPYDALRHNDPLQRLEHLLYRPVNHFIMPVFALANTAVAIRMDWQDLFGSALGIGILAGLMVGKPLGIFSFVWIAVRLGWSKLPGGVNHLQILGIGLLGGIGFTMSMFVTMLAFPASGFADSAKISILVASCISGLAGLAVLSKAINSEKNLAA
ncbi:MAG: Na+/H+ antiporter NhaA [Bacteroidota bacterium]